MILTHTLCAVYYHSYWEVHHYTFFVISYDVKEQFITWKERLM